MGSVKIYDNTPYLIENCEWPEPFITPYLVDSDNDTLMLIFPGGGYCDLAEHEGKGYAEYFNSLGISAVVLNYRCKPYQYPCEQMDARRALRYVKAHAEEYKINPEKIVVVGSSAGGHLAATTSMLGGIDKIDEAEGVDEIDSIKATVAGQILCYPVVSCVEHQIQWCVDNLIGDRKELALKLSPEKSGGSDMPPAFIWHTITDDVVDVRNSLMLATRYKELGIPCELHIFPDGSHGMGLADWHESARQWPSLLETWLKVNGFLKK